MRRHERFHPVREDYRDPYSRDRDRIIQSYSFRKLKYKTQVFLNSEGDYFRTRLTHSIEVSQIARAISKHLGLNEYLAEAIGLGHDLGHSPFGHSGGDELDELMKEDGYENGFDHNFQSFRVVTQLEKRYKDFGGLNLTYATLEGFLKHSEPYKKKFNGHLHEQFHFDYHPSLEAAIVDKSDEIAYLSADIDDALKYHIITFDDLKSSKLVRDVMDIVRNEDGFTDENDELFKYRFTTNLTNHLISKLLEKSTVKKEDKHRKFKADEPLPLLYPKEIDTEIKQLKKLIYQEILLHHKIVTKMFFGKKIMKKLYRAFMKEKYLLPKESRRTGRHHRDVADFLASLTDRSAIEMYKQLYVKE